MLSMPSLGRRCGTGSMQRQLDVSSRVHAIRIALLVDFICLLYAERWIAGQVDSCSPGREQLVPSDLMHGPRQQAYIIQIFQSCGHHGQAGAKAMIKMLKTVQRINAWAKQRLLPEAGLLSEFLCVETIDSTDAIDDAHSSRGFHCQRSAIFDSLEVAYFHKVRGSALAGQHPLRLTFRPCSSRKHGLPLAAQVRSHGYLNFGFS